MTANTNRASRR